MRYVMNNLEQEMYNLIEQDGYNASIAVLARALIEHAHTMSDMGIKDKAVKSMQIVDLLKEIRDIIEE